MVEAAPSPTTKYPEWQAPESLRLHLHMPASASDLRWIMSSMSWDVCGGSSAGEESGASMPTRLLGEWWVEADSLLSHLIRVAAAGDSKGGCSVP